MSASTKQPESTGEMSKEEKRASDKISCDNNAIQLKLQLQMDQKEALSEDFANWSGDHIVEWIVNLDPHRYGVYAKELRPIFKEQQIDGTCLPNVDKNDLMLWKVTKFKDRIDLYAEIKKLTSCRVLKMDEDIWALTYVIVKNRKSLPLTHCLLLLMIFMVQVGSLGVMICNYSAMIHGDIRVQYEMCSSPNAYEYTTNYDDYRNDTGLNDTSCELIVLMADTTNTQTQVHRESRGWANFLFAITALFAFFLLTIYILASLSNPIIMMIIGHQYLKAPDVQEVQPSNCCRDHEKKCYQRMCPVAFGKKDCCSSLSCLLYTMAWANIVLALASFLTGMLVSFTYVFYFGIESPVDIVFAPISIVFILELDNWAFGFVKHFYVESSFEDMWSYPESKVRNGSFDELYPWYRNSLVLLSYVFGFPVMIGAWYRTTIVFDEQGDTVPEGYIPDAYWSTLVCFQFLAGFVYVAPLLYRCFTCCVKIDNFKKPYHEKEEEWTKPCSSCCSCCLIVVVAILSPFIWMAWIRVPWLFYMDTY